jgi:deazaflavin-dependent oxidoreductase (nitroreductase family)
MAVDYEAFTRDLIADIRANGRPTSGPMEGRPLMVLTTIGAKSGSTQQAIVNYSRDGDDYIVAATKSGAPTNPAWYHNLRATPEATVEANREQFRARAVITTDDERQRLWDQHVEAFPYFGEYPSMTERVIPVIRLQRLS